MIRSVPFEEAKGLTAALWAEMVARYGEGQEGPAHPEQFLPPSGAHDCESRLSTRDGGRRKVSLAL